MKEKKIVCYLPHRRQDEEFLAGNRDTDLNILDGQWCKDEETRELIIEAFYDMNEVEKVADATMKQNSEDENLESVEACYDVRSEHNAKPQCEEGVQHSPGTKITDHSPSTVSIVVDGFNYYEEHLLAGLLDMSWLEEYEMMYDKATVHDSCPFLLSILTLVEADSAYFRNVETEQYSKYVIKSQNESIFDDKMT